MGICESREVKQLKLKNSRIEREIAVDKKGQLKIQKLLLLGAAECGKSTILKQMRILHDSGFSMEEVQLQQRIVYLNIIQGMTLMLEARERLGILTTDINSEANAATIMKWQKSGMDREPFSDAVLQALTLLWSEESIRECYRRRNEFQMADCAKYFLDNLERIASRDYLPSDQDILYTRVPTNGVSEVRFLIKGATFRVFDVGGQRSERRKWIHCFDNVNAIIFIVAMSEYDQTLTEDETTNRMHESLNLFKQILNSSVFPVTTSMILFLNKKDLFEEKLIRSPITKAFPEYTGKSDFVSCAGYIQQRFEQLKEDPKKQVYSHQTCATDTGQVQAVLDSVIDTVLRMNITNAGMM